MLKDSDRLLCGLAWERFGQIWGKCGQVATCPYEKDVYLLYGFTGQETEQDAGV